MLFRNTFIRKVKILNVLIVKGTIVKNSPVIRNNNLKKRQIKQMANLESANGNGCITKMRPKRIDTE